MVGSTEFRPQVLIRTTIRRNETSAIGWGLSPLFWTHVSPYGRFELDVTNRLGLALPTVLGPRLAGDDAARLSGSV